MPAKNRDHDAVVAALVTGGWTITHDPYVVTLGSYRHHTAFAAEQNGRRIAVEFPRIAPETDLVDFQRAIGAYALFPLAMRDSDPACELFHAVPEQIYRGIYSEPLGELMIETLSMRLIVFREEDGRILKWVEADGTSTSHVVGSRG